jgi:hypothetical protein
MSYIQGEGRHLGTLFPFPMDDLVPDNRVCRVIDAFVNGLKIRNDLNIGSPPPAFRTRQSG